LFLTFSILFAGIPVVINIYFFSSKVNGDFGNSVTPVVVMYTSLPPNLVVR